jgi:hypothetical protein
MNQLDASALEFLERLLKSSQKTLEFELGVGLQYEYAPPNIRFSAPYYQMGKDFWNAFRKELYKFICNPNELKPKEWVNDLVVGDIRNLAIGIVSALTARYNVSLGIAIPVSALILKSGILKYCREPQQAPPRSAVKKILLDQKNHMKQFSKKVNKKVKSKPKKKLKKK